MAVLFNPRGRVRPPLTEESARAYAFFGVPVSAADIARSQAHAREFPEQGDGQDYDRALAVTLDDNGYRLVAQAHTKATVQLDGLRAEMRTLRSLSRSKREAVADLAAYRADTLREQAVELLKTFATELLNQLAPANKSHVLRMGLGFLLSASKLVVSRGMLGSGISENIGGYETVRHWREHVARDEKERESFSAANHVKNAGDAVERIARTLAQTPAACDRLTLERTAYRKLLVD